MSEPLISPRELEEANASARLVVEELDAILLGRPELHRLVVVAILSRGHVLLEGVPGVGKTALIKSLGQILELDFKRAQFTPDLMPGDILGTNILQENENGRREMAFQPGPIFTNILLADEINRASPKTQSALLEAMQERSVTLLGNTRQLPDPFFVLASQNPIELEGTYPLPEAQLDRFLFKLVVGSSDAETLATIITSRRRGETPAPQRTLSHRSLQRLFETLDRIYLPRAVASYIGRLVAASHPEGGIELASKYVSYGASPRAAIALAEAARAEALLSGRPTAGFEDVRKLAPHVLNHRLVLNYKARLDGIGPFDLIRDLLAQTAETELDLPSGVSVEAAR